MRFHPAASFCSEVKPASRAAVASEFAPTLGTNSSPRRTTRTLRGVDEVRAASEQFRSSALSCQSSAMPRVGLMRTPPAARMRWREASASGGIVSVSDSGAVMSYSGTCGIVTVATVLPFESFHSR